MSKHPLRTQFSALPPYFGGKRKLIQTIFSTISTVIPKSQWQQSTFVDAFMGAGSVSLAAKAYGFGTIYANDWSLRSQLVIKGLLENSRIKLNEMDILALQGFETDYNRIQAELGGDVFSQRHAKAIDQILAYGETIQCPTKRALLLLLLWHLVGEFVAFGTSIGTSNRPFAKVLDGEGSWWKLNTKRLQDKSFERLLKSVWHNVHKKQKTINNGIFGAVGQVQGYHLDAFAFMEQVQGDILYLDPPYPGTLSYEKANKILDQVLFNIRPETVQNSPFTENPDALGELLLKSRHFPLWVISLNNKVFSLESLQSLVQKIDPSRTVSGQALHYKHLAHVSQTPTNQELLILAYKE